MKKLLLDVLSGWLRLAEEKRVYVEYRFTGTASTLYAGRPETLAVLDRAVQELIFACARLPERERWMDLSGRG